MARTKTGNIPDMSVLLAPDDPFMLAAEEAILRGQAWANTATPVADQIAVRIAGLITRDLIQAGQRLLETDISQVLNVSRAPVREAFRILDRERLVELLPRKGAIVTSPDVQELADIYVVRKALYEILLRQLMSDCPGDLDAVFEKHMPQLQKTAREGADSYALASFLLNLEITELCSNRLVVDLLTSISLRTLRYVRLGLASEPDSIPSKVETWHALHRAVASRDLDLVLETAQRRIEHSEAAAVQALAPVEDDAQGVPRRKAAGSGS